MRFSSCVYPSRVAACSSSEAETDPTDRKTEEMTETRTGIAGIETIETTREIQFEAVSVADTATEIETETVAATETGSTR